ncbi:MAG: hypothetical protein RR886_04440 [Cellulosilyticaceae bacterium]
MSIIHNVAKDEYIQTVDCAEIQGVVSTDPVVITIINNQIEFIKTPDNIFVEQGETIPYTLTLKNTSDLTLTKIEVIDILPAGIVLVPNTLKVNGNSVEGDIQTGITISNKLLPGGQLIISFSGIVDLIPPTTYYNTASATYYYQVNSTTGQRSNTIKSNTVLAKAIQGILFVTKTADRKEAQMQDQIVYTIAITNEGNVEATDLIMTDTLPPHVAYVPNTFTLNGVVKSNVDLVAGVPLGNLAVGATDIVQMTVNVIDDSVSIVNNRGNIQYNYVKNPNHPPINNNTDSNFAVVVIHKPIVSITKSTPNTTTAQGEKVAYTLVVENTGTLSISNVVVTDVLPQGMSLVPNSTTINGALAQGNIVTGLNIGTIGVGGKTTVGFTALVNTVPPTTFINTASANFNYVLNGVPSTGSIVSNAVTTTAQSSGGGCAQSLTAMMIANKTQAQKGDYVTYQIMIKNTGSQTVSGVIVNDSLDEDLMLVPRSITIDGAPVQGCLEHLVIGDLPAGAITTVGFTAMIVGGCPGSTIPNQATIQCNNGNCNMSNLQTNLVNVTLKKGCSPNPPCPCPCPSKPSCQGESCQIEPCQVEPYPTEPCPTEPCPIEPYPNNDYRIERVITPVYLPNYMHCIEKISGITGFIKSVKPVSCGYYTKLLVVYAIKIEYTNSSGLCYTYQQCEEVYLEKCKNNGNIVVEIDSVEPPYAVDNRYIEVIINMRICNK